jgi:fumarate hydratase class I
MGAKTLAGLQESGAVYLNGIGGAAQFYARCIERVDGVSLTEFGTPEAMWHLEVRDFPAIVTMDAHGNSLHRDVEVESGKVLATLSSPGVYRLHQGYGGQTPGPHQTEPANPEPRTRDRVLTPF